MLWKQVWHAWISSLLWGFNLTGEVLWLFAAPEPPSLAPFELAVSKGFEAMWAKGPVLADAVGVGGGCR